MCVICTIKLEIIYYRKSAKSIGIPSMIFYNDRPIVLLTKLNRNPLIKYMTPNQFSKNNFSYCPIFIFFFSFSFNYY